MFRRIHHPGIAAALLSLVIALSLLTDLRAQSASTGAESLVQANSRLTTEAKSGLPLSTQARNMLVARHAALVQSFRDSPATARSLALNMATRAALLKQNPAYASLIEQDVPLTGQLVSIIADDFVHHTATKLYKLHTLTGDRALSFAVTRTDLSRMTGHVVTVTGMSLPEIVAAETLREASPTEIRANTVAVPQASGVRSNSTSAAPAITPGTGGVAPGAATALETPLGNQTTAVLILHFSTGVTTYPANLDAPAVWNQLFNGPATPSINAYISEVSYSKASVQADIYTVNLTSGYDCTQVDQMAAAAVAATTNTIDYTKYNHIVFGFPAHNCFFGGLGTVDPMSATTAIPHEYTYIWAPVPDDADASYGTTYLWQATNHEFGHNLGLNHANTLDFGAISLGPLDFVATNPGTVTPDGAPTGASQTPFVTTSGGTPIAAINTEYGEAFSDMGGSQGPFSTQHRYQELSWVDTPGEQDVTASGNFTVTPGETSSGIRALHILRDAASSSWLSLEFHQPDGIYTPFALNQDPLSSNSNNVTSGAQIHYQDGFGEARHTYMLDMTPTTKPNYFFDGNLVPGATWSDPYSPITLTIGAQSSASLPVSVSYDTPCATVSVGSTSLSASNGSSSVSISAPAGCAWAVSSNASWITFSGATSGTGNGTSPFTYTANLTANQRNSYITAARQSIPVVQFGTSLTVVGLSPAATSIVPGASTNIALTMNDGAGASDIGQINMSVPSLNANGVCNIVAVSGDGTYYLFPPSGDGVAVGTPGTISGGACTIDIGKSTATPSGNNLTLSVAVSFPSTFVGVHQVSASFSGSSSNTNTLPVGYVRVGDPIVVAPVYTSTTTLTATPNTITTAQSTVLQATVAGTPAAASLAGTVTFATASTPLGSCTLSGTSCSINVAGSALQLGVNSILATYGGGGSYPSSISNTASVTVTSGTSTQTITFNTLPNVTNGVAPITLAATASSGLPISYTVTGNAAVSGSTLTITGVGTINVTASQAGNASYSAATPVTRSFNVSPATLTVTAANFSRLYGAANPTLTYAVTGFVRSDTSTVVSGSATLSTTATATSPVSSYPITFSAQGLTATNYTFTYVNGSLQVTVTPQTITFGPMPNVTYGVSPITLTGTASSGLAITYLVSGPATVSGSTLTVNGTGSITVTATQAGNGNYSAAGSVAQTFTSNPPAAGSVTLTTQSTLQRLADNSYRSTVTIKNTGTGTAQSVQMNVATLGSANGTPAGGGSLPVSLGSIASGASAVVTFNFPASAGTPGAGSSAKFTGTYTGGTFGGTSRVTLP